MICRQESPYLLHSYISDYNDQGYTYALHQDRHQFIVHSPIPKNMNFIKLLPPLFLLFSI